DWVRSEINLDVVSEALPLYIKISGPIAGIVFITFAVLIVFLARRRTVIVSPEEVEIFLSGNEVHIPGHSETLDVDNLAFNHNLRISSRDLMIGKYLFLRRNYIITNALYNYIITQVKLN
ncbi:unnamed protein product, partial [Allacma fusca]